MYNDQEKSRHVRSINNVVQGVDLTPDDPKYATFKQHRYFIGVRSAEPSLNKISRELLDPAVPSPLPKPPSKAPVVVEGVDHTPDDPDWVTLYEYRYDKDGVREGKPACLKRARHGLNVEMDISASGATLTMPGGKTMSIPAATAQEIAEKFTINPQQIILNHDHPQFSSLRDQIETTQSSASTYIERSNLRHESKVLKGLLDYPQFEFTQRSAIPPPKQPSPPPTSPSPVKLKMGSNKKRTIFKKASCSKCSSVVLKQGCRIHKAVLDSKHFVEQNLILLGSTFEDLANLKDAWNHYDAKIAKELCGACSELHGKGLTKSQFQKEHKDLIESFYDTVGDMRGRFELLLEDVEEDKKHLENIVYAARNIGLDRGEDDTGEMHLLSNDLFGLYEEDICAFDELIEEFKKDRPFHFLDEYRDTRHAQAEAMGQALYDREMEQLAKENAVELREEAYEMEGIRQEKEDAMLESRKAGLAARERCTERKLAQDKEAQRTKKWQDKMLKTKLIAMVHEGEKALTTVKLPPIFEVDSLQWWVEVATQENNLVDGGNGDIFRSLQKRELLRRLEMEIGAEWGPDEDKRIKFMRSEEDHLFY